jgi:serine phosphatase RsbU (regulator of sigma subunit)
MSLQAGHSEPAADPKSDSQDLWHLQREAFVAGRWVLFAAELLAAALRYREVERSLSAEVALLLLVVYHLVTLLALWRVPTKRPPAALLLGGDVLTVGTLVALTEGIESPFASLFALVSLAGALYYNLPGGLAVAIVGSAVILLSSAALPGVWKEILHGETRTQLIPFLILHGGVAGFFVSRLTRFQEQRAALADRLRQAEFAERVRRREAEVAREIQRATLPGPLQHRSFVSAVRFIPIGDVGGDFYSFLADGGRLGILLGDVSGKGVPAALISTSICHLSHCLPMMPDPERFLAALNADLLDRLPDWAFASLAIAIIDPDAGELTVYNAGHPPPFVIRNGEVRWAGRPGLPMGVLPSARYEPEVVAFTSGDTLVLYSDGCVEVRDESGNQLSLEGLEEILRRDAALTVEELATRIVDETRRFGTVQDDLTLVLVRSRQPLPRAE